MNPIFALIFIEIEQNKEKETVDDKEVESKKAGGDLNALCAGTKAHSLSLPITYLYSSIKERQNKDTAYYILYIEINSKGFPNQICMRN